MRRASLASLFLGLALALGSSPAFSQCSGQPPAGRLCANGTASGGLPGWYTQSAVLDRNFGAPSAQGTVLNRGASLWTATSSPILGLNGGNSGAIVLEGSSTGSATIGVKAAAGNTTFNLPVGNGTANQVLITDGSGNTSWTTAGAGTVSSVGLALPSSILAVSGSPVTGIGTLTGTLATQSANLVWSGPTTGSAATPTFRSLVGADLPNPSASSLGGIQSFAAVSSQWIRQISTTGVPTASQPAFSDISGSITPAQCPNPSASTIGCIQSYVAVANQWINAISTSGVPSSTQPNFTNLAGSATLGQLPSIGNNSVLGNNSGGSAVPSTLTGSNVLDMIASTQGDVLYRAAGGTGWVALAPGTSGQVLTTGGAAANPAWATVTGTGTVTSVATGTGLTGGAITTTGTISLAAITSLDILANITGGSAAPIPNTMTAILDATLGSTQGDILYRGASVWQVLAPGTNGQVLTQGASTPSWAGAGSVSSVATNGGVKGGTITTSGTLSLDGNYSGWALDNCTLAASVGSSLLTVALKDNAGNDPSSTSPCNINYRNVTPATGSTTLVAQTAALSISTFATGATLGSSNNTAFRFWVVVFNNAGTNVLALINCSTLVGNTATIFPLNEGVVASSTPFSAGATSAGVFYTPNGTTVTSKSFRIVGYIEYNATGLVTAGTYATGPNFIQTFGPGIRKPGETVQIASATSTSAATFTSTTYVTMTGGFTLSITPVSAANPIRVEAFSSMLQSGTASTKVQLSRGTTAATNLFGAVGQVAASGGGNGPIALVGFDIPNTTSAQLYAIQGKTSAATITSPSAGDVALMTAQEIMG